MQYSGLRKFISRLLTFYLPKKYRKNCRNKIYNLLNFSIREYLHFKFLNYTFISLGDHCLTRMLLTGAHFKPQKKYGEKTCPFDLALHYDINAIAHCIQTDFSDYYNCLEFKYSDVCKKELWQNEKLNSLYVHEEELNFEQFKKRYDSRIKNFLSLMQDKKNIYFVYSNYTINENYPKKEDIINLYNTIKEKRNNNKFSLILLLEEYIEGIEENNIYQIISHCPDTLEIAKGCGGLFQLLTIGKIENHLQVLDISNEALTYYNYVSNEIKKIINLQ